MHPIDNETTILPSNKIACDFVHDNGDDFDLLHTLPDDGDVQEHENFPTYKNGEGTKF